MRKLQLFIEGRGIDPDGGRWFPSYNPYLGEPWCEVARSDANDVNRAVEAAHRAFTDGPWPQMTASERGLLLHRFGDRVAK